MSNVFTGRAAVITSYDADCEQQAQRCECEAGWVSLWRFQRQVHTVSPGIPAIRQRLPKFGHTAYNVSRLNHATYKLFLQSD
jgi:hypothetical protein